ncbi:DUF1707 SHOCT-like domain-containing protein [Kutzneria sp. CA-103260]|uniref:DUF1707 SHOCT-like domain-containing protein n=1 Tax=Kutzneria sp. CA-103260 TaxID=2802641 RepID=UPI001BED6CB4|nr:DUF1707 domain-containing protein [Kutzneria sp. CA-103260]QUQ64907.1 hypothetical protein JJ691_26280 [Kutzneria sp. CA-103260]
MTQMRASNEDRERVVERLNDAVGKGLLTLAEAEERIAAAYDAKFLDDLPPLTADLPDPTPPPRPEPKPGRRRAPGFDPRLLVALAVIAGVLVLSHGFALPLIVLAVVATKFGRWRHCGPARM